MRRSPSAASASASAGASGLNGSVRTAPSSTRQVPAAKPSTRKNRVPATISPRCSSAMIRVRSAWARKSVVELRQEARRRGRGRVGERRAGQVEQLAAALVGVGDEPRAQPGDRLPDAGRRRTTCGCPSRRRPERGEVAQHERVGPRLRPQLGAEPPLRGREPRRPASGPRARAAAAARPGPCPPSPSPAPRARPRRRSRRAAGRPRATAAAPPRAWAWRAARLVEPDAAELAPQRADHALAQQLRDHRPEREAVARGHEVHGGAHQHDPHRLAPLQQPVELGRVEALQPRPEPDERRLRLLRLHPGEVLEHARHRERRALEQVLAGEQRPVQRAAVEDPLGHVRSLGDEGLAPAPRRGTAPDAWRDVWSLTGQRAGPPPPAGRS